MDTKPITVALERAMRGEPGAPEELWELVYGELKRMAAGRLGPRRAGGTLQATALVHEAWMRLQNGEPYAWNSRAHFFGAAAHTMRNILVDHARSKNGLRRNGGVRPLELSTEIAEVTGDERIDDTELLALDEALTAMGRAFERPTQIVMLRFFAGLTIAEIADILGVTQRTVDRDFLFARTWLRRHMERD